MAERRMFARHVVQSSEFMALSATAGLLYFELGMAADDDGVVGGRFTMKAFDATDEHLKELETMGFVTVLNSAPLVYINHWLENNRLRKDCYRPSSYRSLLEERGLVEVTPMRHKCNEDVTQERKGKERKGECSTAQENQKNAPAPSAAPEQERIPDLVSVKSYCMDNGFSVDPKTFVDYYSTITRLVEIQGDWQRALDKWAGQAASFQS